MDPEDLDITVDLEDTDSFGVNDSGDASNIPDGTVLKDTVPAVQKQGEYSLRDQLSNAFKGTTETENTQTDNQQQKQTEAPQLTTDAEGRYRRADGTFASATEVEAYIASQSQSTGPDIEKFVSQLPAAVAEEIKSLPEKTRDFIVRTMEDLNGRATRYSEYDQLESIIGPRRDAWAQNGMNSLVAINQLFALSDFAGTNPGEFVLWFADNNGLDLDALLDARDAANAQVTPEVQQLRTQVQNLNSQLQQIRGPQQDPGAQYLEVVQNFAAEKDEGGNLKRPYLPEVMNDFGNHVSVVRSANPNMRPEEVLAKAYENACWANPAVRTKMQAEVERQRVAAIKAKQQSARQATSSISGGPDGDGMSTGTTPGNRSLREELQAQFRAHLN